MDKEKNTRLPLVDLIEVKPMQDGYRWVAITAMLFAIGIILHTVSPNVGGVTPNWTIAMYSIVMRSRLIDSSKASSKTRIVATALTGRIKTHAVTATVTMI